MYENQQNEREILQWRLLTPPEQNHYITFYIKELQTITQFSK